LPSVHLKTRLLRSVFIGAEIENQYGLCHACSISAPYPHVKGDAILDG
jgi:hypothetical protein